MGREHTVFHSEPQRLRRAPCRPARQTVLSDSLRSPLLLLHGTTPFRGDACATSLAGIAAAGALVLDPTLRFADCSAAASDTMLVSAFLPLTFTYSRAVAVSDYFCLHPVAPFRE
jgi:hypothetical protein